MIPKLQAIDHIHISVFNWRVSEIWYRRVLGLTRVSELEIEVSDKVPLTIANADGNIQLALFQNYAPKKTVIAFSVTGQEYLNWYKHLGHYGLDVSHNDKGTSWSLYFTDPDRNPFEIKTYDYRFVQEIFSSTAHTTLPSDTPKTPLMNAVESETIAVVEELIAICDTDKELFRIDNKRRTVLFYAAIRGDVDIIWSLLKPLRGTGFCCPRERLLNIRDNEGRLAEDLADRSSHAEAWEILSGERARINFCE